MEIDAVGAIAVLLENLSLIPNSSPGHASSSARSFEALSTFCILENVFIPCFAHIEPKGILFAENKNVNPLHRSNTFSFGSIFCVAKLSGALLINLLERYQNLIISSTKFLSSFHSSYFSIFSEDKQHTAVLSFPSLSFPVGSVISLHKFEVLTFNPASLWCCGI